MQALKSVSRHSVVIAVCLGALSALWPAWAWGGTGQPGDDPVYILPLGDSITQANTSHNSYRRSLWFMLQDWGCAEVDFVGSMTKHWVDGPPPNPDFDQDHEGHWGWRTDQVLEELPDWLADYTPDIALIHLGSNDMFQSRFVESAINDLKSIINVLRADNPDVTVLLSLVIPTTDFDINLRIHSLNVAMYDIPAEMSTQRSPIIIVNMPFGFEAATDTYDGVHPNEQGEQKMAQRWFDELEPLLAVDGDNDGACDRIDNCLNLANADQLDTDGDGAGDACDVCPEDPNDDSDGDGLCGDVDNCPDVPNGPNEDRQADGDADGVGDACDNCPGTKNGPAQDDQADADGDGAGDACDTCPNDPDDDLDGDNVCGDVDNCPFDPNGPAQDNQADADGDGKGDACDICINDPDNDVDGDTVCGDVDNCPDTPNGPAEDDQADLDGDGLGDACDECPLDADNDTDGDDVCGNLDNCPDVANGQNEDNQANADGDARGDACDPCPNDPDDDADGDGVCGDIDNCPAVANGQNDDRQADGDGDDVGDACDNCPDQSNTDQANADDDEFGDICDPCPDDAGNDADGDGLCGDVDNCPDVANGPGDEDNQGDEDGDGAGDACDNCLGLSNPDQANADGDDLGDLCDDCPNDAGNDADGDGLCADVDNCPNASNPDQLDSDGDGIGDVCEPPPGGGGGPVGGGGGLPPEEPPNDPTQGSGTTGSDGTFEADLEDEEGNPLGRVAITGAPAGEDVTYETVNSTVPGPGGGTFAGFADGVGLGRTLVVTTSAPDGSFIATLSMTFTEAELAALGVDPADIEIHVFDDSQPPPPGRWSPAGSTAMGESQPTGNVGDNGYFTGPGDTVTFWVVVDHLSQFAVGKPVTEDQEPEPADTEPDPEPVPPSGADPSPDHRPDTPDSGAADPTEQDDSSDTNGAAAPCGFGAASAMSMTAVGLAFMQHRRRRPRSRRVADG